ncbi:MAG: hypothetical protein H7263_18045, partial [Candidatus Sericytochromatia bacterium]|nr:hypothetical protein [Candidatus Sericytochromatia bacterium]
MKFNKKALLILISILPLPACVTTPQQPVSSFRPIASPAPQLSLQQSGEWQTEDNVSKSTVTITKISDNLYNFSGKALPKNGDSVYNTSGTISYKGDEAIFMYEKPG